MTQTDVGSSVFAHLGDDGVFRRYHLRLDFRHTLHGGIPKIAAAMDGNAEAETMIGQWLKATTGHYDRQTEEIAQAIAAAMKAGAAVENAALVEAAQDLYANELRAFARVIFPPTLPGIVAGSILVFIPSLGAYVTPDLLGGAKSVMIGNVIQSQFLSVRDYPFGSAFSFVLMAMMLVATLLYFRVGGRTL